MYVHQKQTYSEVGAHFQHNQKWAQRIIGKRQLQKSVLRPCKTALCVDAAFFGDWGFLVFRSPTLQQNLIWYEIKSELLADYERGIQELIQAGFEITGVTVDGKPGVLQAITRLGIPAQMCYFHMIQIVTRQTTRYPRLPAACELLDLVRLLPLTDRVSFEYWLAAWHTRWLEFLAEESLDPVKQKTRFKHERLRKAHRSLLRHLPYLFTYHAYTGLSGTNNSIEGVFSQLKTKVKVHRGLSKERKKDLICELLGRIST